MSNCRNTANSEIHPNLHADRRGGGSTMHPELKAKIEKRIRSGFYDKTEVIRELANRILKFCITK
jgi:hypothetical protein